MIQVGIPIVGHRGALNMPNITDHPDDYDREWAYRRGYAHGAAAVIAALRPHLPEEMRRRAETWLAREVTPWRARFEPKVTEPPEFPSLDYQRPQPPAHSPEASHSGA
jgi:hypothetical protein